jgi:hypothetical protein
MTEEKKDRHVSCLVQQPLCVCYFHRVHQHFSLNFSTAFIFTAYILRLLVEHYKIIIKKWNSMSWSCNPKNISAHTKTAGIPVCRWNVIFAFKPITDIVRIPEVSSSDFGTRWFNRIFSMTPSHAHDLSWLYFVVYSTMLPTAQTI